MGPLTSHLHITLMHLMHMLWLTSASESFIKGGYFNRQTQKWTKCLMLADSDQERRCRIECCDVAYPLATRPVAGFYQNFLHEYYVD